MAFAANQWHIQHRDHNNNIIADFAPANEITFDMNWNTPSSATYQLARSDPLLGRDSCAPYRTDCFIWRGQDLILSGPHTSRKWDSDDEGVINIAMQDWMHLLEKLYYPVEITGYTETEVIIRKDAYTAWPPDPMIYTPAEVDRDGIDLNIIVQELLDIRNAIDDIQWEVAVLPTGGGIPHKAFHVAEGLDSKSWYDHIKELSELHLGFDFQCKWLGKNRIQVGLWHYPGLGTKSSGKPLFNFTSGEQFIRLAWEDTGPKGTRTYGLAQGYGNIGRLAAQSIYPPSDLTYRRLEVTEDVGDIADYYQYDSDVGADGRIIQRMTGSAGHRNRGPIHQVELEFDTQVLPFSWWQNCGPGDRIHIDYDFGFHRINSDYTILGYTGTVTPQGDEIIKPDLERILPYNTTKDDSPVGS